MSNVFSFRGSMPTMPGFVKAKHKKMFQRVVGEMADAGVAMEPCYGLMIFAFVTILYRVRDLRRIVEAGCPIGDEWWASYGEFLILTKEYAQELLIPPGGLDRLMEAANED